MKYKKFTHVLKYPMLLLSMAFALVCRGQVNIKITVVPPYPSHFTDYASHPQQIMIMLANTGSTALNIQLRGSLTGDNGIGVRVSQSFRSPSPIHLNAGEVRNLSGTDINALFDYNLLTFSGITRDQLAAQGNLPEGNYQICARAYDYYTNVPLSEDQPSGCSNTIPISSVEPPTIISPADGTSLNTTAGQNFVITWSTPAGSPPSIQYAVKMVEILDTRSPENAIQSSTQPAFFQTTFSGVTALLYNPSMPALTVGRRYALIVTASDPSNTVTFRNNGQSEVIGFTYGEAAPPITAPVVTVNDSMFTITGNIKWYFRKGEENAPGGRALPPGPATELNNVPGNIAHPYANMQVNVSLFASYSSKAMSKLFSHGPASKPHKGIPQWEIDDEESDYEESIEEGMWNGGSGIVTTDANGNFQYQVNYYNILRAIGDNPRIGLSAGQTLFPDSLELSVSARSDRIDVDGYWGNDYGAKGVHLPFLALKPQGTYSFGNVIAYPRSYKFIPRVVDANGNELTDATVNIYRRADFYATNPIPEFEGNLNADQGTRPSVTIDGASYVKIASLPSGYEATRLFYSDGGADNYKILVQDGTYTDYNTSIAVQNSSTMYDTYQQTFSMANVPVTFTGHVHKTVNNVQQDAAGAVIFMQDVLGQLFFGTADSSGNFTIVNGMRFDWATGIPYPCNITPAATQQYFTVAYHGQAIIDSVLIDKQGEKVDKEIGINANVYNITGQVVDDAGKTIPSPLVHWASGGTYAQVDAQSNFTAPNTAGTDTLIISKLGYADKRIPIIIADNGTITALTGTAAPVGGRRTAAPTRQGATSFVTDGYIGNVTLNKAIGKLNIYVVDNNRTPVPNATVLVTDDNFDSLATVTTDYSGTASVTGPSGYLMLTVNSIAGTHYLATQSGLYAPADGTTTNTTVVMTNGVLITGKVTNGNSPVANATVQVEYEDVYSATTKADGTYAVVVPMNSGNLEATKPGLLADIKQGTYYTTDATVNFSLTTSSVNITKIMGFDVQIDQMTNKGNNKVIGGSFINLPSNSMFTFDKNTKLPFSDIEVQILGDGTAVPVGDKIETNVSTINFKAFGYLPLTLSKSDDDYDDDVIAIVKTDAAGKHGQIAGETSINFGSFVPAGIAQYASDGTMVTNNNNAATAIVVATDDGSLPGNALQFATGSPGFNVYGFNVTIDLNNSSIKQDGLHIAGSVNLSNIPVLAGTQLNLQDVWVGTDGTIKNVAAQTPMALKIASWNGQINSLSFSDNGFTLGGAISFQLPGSSGSNTLNFNNLSLATDQLYGGSFTLPSQGVSVFNLATLTSNQALTFGKQGSEGVYFVSGSGTVSFSGAAATFINNLTVNSFQIQTDGTFAVNVAANIHKNFLDIATMDITQVSFSDVNDNPVVDIASSFSLSIPGVSATAGGLHFKRGGAVSVDDLNFGFDVAGIAKANVNVSFQNNPGQQGFAGQGSFNVAGFADVNVNFYYYKVGGGVSVGTSFSAATAIPLGTSGLVITQLGGGFQLNTARNTWQIGFNGFVSVGEGTFTGAQVGFTIANGPVIKGWANLQLVGLQIAQGNLTIDVPNSLFAVNFTAGVNIAGIAVNAGGNMVLSLNRNDKYFLLGTYASVDALGLIKIKGAACLTWNFNTNKHRYDGLAQYVSCIDPQVMQGGIFTGTSVYSTFNASADGILPNFDFHVIVDLSIHSYCNFNAYGYVTAGLINNTSPTFAVNLGEAWDFGASISAGILGIDFSAGLGVGFNANLKGIVSVNPTHVAMQASAGAFLQGAIGDFTIVPGRCVNGYDLSNWPWHDWVAVCVDVSLTVGYDSWRSPQFYAHF